MYTRSRGTNQTPQNTSFVRGPTLNPQNPGYQTGNAQAAGYPQSGTPQKQGQMQNQGQNQGQTPGQQMKQQQQQKPAMQQQQQTPQKPFLQGQQGQQTPQQGQQKFGQQQQQQPQQQTPQQQPQQQQQTPNKIVTGILKTPAANTNNQNNSQAAGPIAQSQENSMDYEDVMPEGDGFSETSDQPKWRRSKLQGTKVNRKLRRLRMNQRLRKTLMPKNAIMVLNEMKAGVQFTFPETQSVPNSVFLVHAELDGKTYVGQGLSKPLARQNAAENALKCLLLEKMTAAANKARTDAESDPQGAPDSTEGPKDDALAAAAAAAVGDGTNPEGAAGTPMNVDDTDEIPWSSLASFALYKLFLEWQNQGTVVPIPRPGTQTPPKVKTTESKPAIEKVLPENALSVHPVMLLNQMKPGIVYLEVSRTGNPPNTMFTLSVEIDGKAYTGSAKNKRDAKKIAAKSALKALYNLDYPEEVKTEVTEPMQVTEQMMQQPLQ